MDIIEDEKLREKAYVYHMSFVDFNMYDRKLFMKKFRGEFYETNAFYI